MNDVTATATSKGVYTDFRDLTRLQQKAAGNGTAAVKEASKQYEAVFIQMMLKSMRQALPGDPLFGSQQEDMYQDLFDKQVSMSMAAKGTIGLADIIARQLQRNMQTQDRAAPGPGTVSGTSQPPAAAATGSSPAAFVKSIWPYAQQAAAQLGVDPRALVAQAALETGWGQGVIRKADGSSTHNLFGIKAGGDWQKETAQATSLEYRNGSATEDTASFRVYDSLAASFQDYVKFLHANPRYSSVLLHATDPRQFASALQESGYSTDPMYAQKIVNVLGSDVLASAMSAIKIPEKTPLT